MLIRTLFVLSMLWCMLSPPLVLAQIQTGRVVEQSSQAANSNRATTAQDTNDRIIAQTWGLTPEEMTRYKNLDRGFRQFFAQDLSPLEVLGIHARNDTERTRYAERFARAQYEDLERILAFEAARQAAFVRLYPNAQIVNYAGLPKVSASIGAADAANVPRGLIIEKQPAPSSRVPGRK